MSRYIDPDEPLSPGDRAYLLERNKHRQVRLHDARVGSGTPALAPTTPPPGEEEPVGTGAVETEPEQPTEPANSPDEVEWVKSLDMDELKAELKEAKQPVSGNKGELQERLLKVLAAQD